MNQSHTPDDVHTIGLLGFGTVEAGIAQAFAASGREVRVHDADAGGLASGADAVSTFIGQGIGREKGTEAERRAIEGRITTTTRIDDLVGVDLVVESVAEDVELKRSALVRVAETVDNDTPIVTNTSVLSVTELATAVPHPNRVAGLHFCNPLPVTRTVEIVRALQTDDALVDRLIALVETLEHKVPVSIRDRPGFLVNALLLPYLNDVIAEYDAGLATAEDLDTAIRLGLGYRAGPLEMLDMIGLDVHLHATEATYAATGDPRYASPPLLRRMVAAGRLGTKSGIGFRTGVTRSGPATSAANTHLISPHPADTH